MPHQSSQFVTTGFAIEGWKILDHLGVVASHAVAGTGLVSEFFAGFSDIFGGRSNAYRRQLDFLYRDTVADLHRQARSRGGNWLVGLRIDLDEVSGKGAQMFMITGLATAVRARRLPSSAPEISISGEFIESSEITTMAHRLALLKSLQADSSTVSDADWAFLVEHRVQEACLPILGRLSKSYKESPVDARPLRTKIAAVFSAVPSDFATSLLHDALHTPSLAPAAVDIICDCGLGSYRLVAAALASPDFDFRRFALQTLKADQPSYTADSLAEIDSLRSLIPDAFPPRSIRTERKGVLGGAKQMWQCICGRSNAVDESHCGACFRDEMGFRRDEISPTAAIRKLDVTHAALSAVVAERGDIQDCSLGPNGC